MVYQLLTPNQSHSHDQTIRPHLVGKQWLNSFNDIDNSNRLPRGKSYARKGRAHSIAIDGNTVTAKVDGSARRPYRVSVSVTSFTKQEKEAIVKAITDNPLFLSQLLARELPPRVHEVLIRQRIDLFSRQLARHGGEVQLPRLRYALQAHRGRDLFDRQRDE